MLPLHIYETVKLTVLLPDNKDKPHEWFFSILESIVINTVRLNPSFVQTDEEIRSDLNGAIKSLMVPTTKGLIVDDQSNFDPDWINRLDKTKWEYWPALYKYLGEYRSPARSLSVLSSLDKTSDDVLSQIGSPEVMGQRFGLVIGYVQSGKTENFTALIAKAADSGYRLVIVLSGVDDEIRKQTQQRISTHIFGIASGFSDHGVKFPERPWHQLTSREDDFQTPNTVANNLLRDGRPSCLVIKKNGPILKRVSDWLEQVNPEIKENLPVLIIDDEADQASLNVARNDPENSPTVINRRIRSILGLFKRSRYVAYTATPFANFFIDSQRRVGQFGDDLYPRDFIFSLPTPPEYLGAADVYGLPCGVLRDGIEVNKFDGICQPCGDDPSQINPSNINNTPGLTNSIYSFILGTATMCIQKGHDNFPTSMIVHASHTKANHEKHKKSIDAVLAEARQYLTNPISSEILKARFRNLYSSTIVKKFNYAKENNFPVPDILPIFDSAVWDKIVDLLTNTRIFKILIINGSPGSDSIPKWDTPSSPDVNIKSILVGGNLLSRGLTIPNLLSSYFMRTTEQADTMLQMSRWLGYRRAIAYLMSVYATNKCHEDLTAIAAAEQDIRNQILEMRRLGKKPIDFQFVVRLRAGLIPTREAASRNSQVQSEVPNFAKKLLETFCFDQNDMPALHAMTENNIKTLQRALESSTSKHSPSPRHTCFCINSAEAVKLITGLSISLDEPSLGIKYIKPGTGIDQYKLLTDYISNRINENELSEWEIVVCGLKGPVDYPQIILSGSSFNPVQRGRESDTSAKIKNVGIGRDEFDSLYEDELEKVDRERKKSGLSESDGSSIRSLRGSYGAAKGKIFVYPITKFSNQNSDSALFSADVIDDAPPVLLAFGISLPGSTKADQAAIRGFINITTT